jgi:hypothetical protein
VAGAEVNGRSMGLDILELIGELLIEFAPEIAANVFRKCEPIAPGLGSSKVRVQTLFGSDGWWSEQ